MARGDAPPLSQTEFSNPYVREMLKMLPVKPEPIIFAQIFAKLTSNGRIHPLSTEVEPS
ncbi:hypothetical protein F7734_05240 [Scytonema sp. UIC 10036]|nr:hypothetical protein [Scytonema sp. UIC 10036]